MDAAPFPRRAPTLTVMAALLAGCAGATGATRPVARTDRGEVQGVVRNGAVEFRGIPYAAPPVGEHRFGLPRPAEAWTGVRDATDFGSACLQTRRYALTEPSTTEDCLTLNVSTPPDLGPGERLPVLVFP